jgi:TatD DNase family protein
MLIDSHCHLDAPEFDADRAAVAAAAQAAGVAKIVVPAVERANFAAVASVCRDTPGCAAAYGIHPMRADRAGEEDLAALRATLAAHPAVAVGEIGLDFFIEHADVARQQRCFTDQLKLARELGLPVLLHVRRAVDSVLRELRRIDVPGGIAHAFNGSLEQAQAFIKLGFKLGFGGAMTYERAKRIRRLAAVLPLSSIVLETDAPDIPPSWLGRTRNSPAELPRIAACLATLRGIAVDEVAAATSANCQAALPRLAP